MTRIFGPPGGHADYAVELRRNLKEAIAHLERLGAMLDAVTSGQATVHDYDVPG